MDKFFIGLNTNGKKGLTSLFRREIGVNVDPCRFIEEFSGWGQ
jgi:hypothetical protein